MKVQVADGLAGLLAAVGDHTEVSDPQVMGHLGDDLKDMGRHRGVFPVDLPAGADVGLGDDQEVDGSLGVDVVEGIDLFVLIDLVGRDLARRNVAE